MKIESSPSKGKIVGRSKSIALNDEQLHGRRQIKIKLREAAKGVVHDQWGM